ncbi:MAG: HNH endonuclease [Saprospiraceae bacterium]
MPKIYLPKEIRNALEKLANGCCEYCKCLEDYVPGRHSNEHIIPTSRGGSNKLENLARACGACNGSKYIATTAIDSKSNKIVPLFHPRKDNWHSHFKWSDDLLKMEGLTSIGRATINRLKTNRKEIMNLRSVLIGHGHPPD